MSELKFTGRRMVKTEINSKLAIKGAEKLLQEYESLGHGQHFQGQIPRGKDFALVKFMKEKYDRNVAHVTVLWTSHNFLFMILHEEIDFI